MDILVESAVPHHPGDVVFRETRFRNWAFAIVTGGLFLAVLFIYILWSRKVEERLLFNALCLWFGGTSGFFFLFAQSSLRATYKPSNWLLRHSPDRLYIKFRSFLNHRLPSEDKTVIALSFDEIAWIREHREKKLVPGPEDGEIFTEKWAYLDIGLKSPHSLALDKCLKKERTLLQGRTYKYRGVYLHFPVSVVDENIIRIEWRSHKTSITPGITKTLQLLHSSFMLNETDATQVDLTHFDELPTEEQDRRIRALVASGEVFQAIALLKNFCKLSTTEAKRRVDKLARR